MFAGNILKKSRTVLIVFVGLFVFAADARGKEVAGVVMSVSGTWLVDGAKIYRGQKLPAGALIKAKEPNPKYSRVVILLLDHTEISRICDRKGNCGEPIKLPDEVKLPRGEVWTSNPRANPGPPSFWRRVVDTMNSFRARRPRYRKTLARGGSSPQDAVVRLDKGQIDLQPVLSNLDRQPFLLTIETIEKESDDTAEKIIERLPLSWSGKGRAVISVPKIRPGLYSITFTPTEVGKSSRPKNVWILVVKSSKFQSVSSEYRRMRALTENWDDRTEPSAETFLRAFLETLALEGNSDERSRQ